MNAPELERLRQCRGVFLDFGDTLAFNNIGFKEGLFLALHSAGLLVEREQVRQAVIRADADMREEHRNARDAEAYRLCRLRYYGHVLDVLEIRSPGRALPEYLHKIMPFYSGVWLRPETVYVLDTLRENGYGLGVVSNFSHALPRLLEELSIADRFDFVTYSDDVGAEKPEPAIFMDALEKSGLPPEAVIHVGDSYEADVEGAGNVGITPVWLAEEPLPDPDCIRITSLLELLSLLNIDHRLAPPTGKMNTVSDAGGIHEKA